MTDKTYPYYLQVPLTVPDPDTNLQEIPEMLIGKPDEIEAYAGRTLHVPEFVTKDSGERQAFDTGMVRDVQKGKPRFDLVWKPLLWRWAELMGRGAEKYGERNWEKAETATELSRFQASAERHLMQWLRGDTDEDHAAAVVFNLAGAEYTKERINGKADSLRRGSDNQSNTL